MIEIVYRYDPKQPGQYRQPGTPAEARSVLEQGNRAFAELLSDASPGGPMRQVIPFDPRNLGMGEEGGIGPVQQPCAAVLGCSDARVPTEMVFRQGSNSLFVVRLAGNVVGNETLGSLRYAVRHFAGSRGWAGKNGRGASKRSRSDWPPYSSSMTSSLAAGTPNG